MQTILFALFAILTLFQGRLANLLLELTLNRILGLIVSKI
ncbi:hypothetical protein LEP1GSC021_2740 [Leptospira noguchii str. 1993005606]|nr:hypothetical protein LEP1GSC021_2740 [Leptospira noguchii str. 1993005606]